MAGISSSMSVRPCITTQFPMIGGRRTQQLAPHGHWDDTAARSRRPASPVLSSSRKAKAHKIVAGDGVDFPGSRYSYYGDLLSILDSSRTGSCKDDAVVTASGEGGCGVVPPLNGGGGGRGEEESGNPGGSGDPLLVWILTKMKPKLQKDPQDLDVAFKMLADYLTAHLQPGEGTALAGLGVDAVADLQEKTGNLPCPSASDDDSSISISGNLQYPSRCDSSTSMSTENPECPSSSFDAVSSRRIGTVSPMGVEGGHSSENHVERRSVWKRIVQLAKNQLTTFWGPRTATIASPVTNPAVNRNKGLLGAFHTISEKLFIFCGALVMWAFQYPVGANARLSFNDGRMQAIIMGSIILSVTSLFFLAPLASYVKESESVDTIQSAPSHLLLGLCVGLSGSLR